MRKRTPLYNLRRSRTMTQADLGRLAQVSQQSISKAERALLQLTPDVQARIAAILGVPRHEVFPQFQEEIAS